MGCQIVERTFSQNGVLVVAIVLKITTMTDDDEGWQYSVWHIYQPVMVEFMNFFHGGEDYPEGKVFTKENLLEIRPNDIKRFLTMKAYNDPDADPSTEGQDQHMSDQTVSTMTRKHFHSSCHTRMLPGCKGKAIQPKVKL
jgi:hypothetical protein